ncbi:MAG: D-tyrosyl-tRNA(Tyr) deacylase [Planctomycetes bacterium]|nr:D-tyrosyl-tRNA(Tyr) deacylase [Planctomycetota bacterium]MCB9917288.1 D-tyrosyl-tRNA(Tyr) deacylase [Planctomycetota bacterium]
MIACLQRVSSASVTVDGEVVGAIERGFLVLLGVAKGDTEDDARRLAQRVAGYRLFPNEDGSKPIDRSALDLGYAMLVVSQFTLCADTHKGMRPGFDRAAPPEVAESLYRVFVDALRHAGIERVETGRFRASMQVSLVNDGPVTVWLETKPRV